MLQKVEVITGKERRRRWSDEEKLRLVAETYAPGSTVAGVARRHEVAESCLYTWRKRFADAAASERPLLIPVSIEDERGAAAAPSPPEPAAIARALVVLPDGDAAGGRRRLSAERAGGLARSAAASLMIPVPSGVRVWLAAGRTDMM